MSPTITSVPPPTPEWALDVYTPCKPTAPLSTGASASGAYAFQSYAYGQDDSTWEMQRASFAGGGGLNTQATRGQRWARTIVAAAGTAGSVGGFNQWSPQLDPATCPALEDPNNKIAWLRLWALAGETAASATDCQGFALCPDDGRSSSSTQWNPSLATAFGGFGVFNRVGGGLRYASYAAGGVLLEAINIAGPLDTGWNCVDFIIRQAVRGNATTPWLSLRINGTYQFRERAFGDPLLEAPQVAIADAHGWGWFMGITGNQTGRFSFRYRMRTGRFHPDGYEQR